MRAVRRRTTLDDGGDARRGRHRHLPYTRPGASLDLGLRASRRGRRTSLVLTALVMAAGAFLPPLTGTASSAPPQFEQTSSADDPAPVSAKVVEQLAEDGTTDFWVRFDTDADLSGAEQIAGWNARGQYVVDRLRATANAAQAGAKSVLENDGAEFEHFWISNTILVHDGDQTLVEHLAETTGVERITAPQTYRIPEPKAASAKDVVAEPEWNIADIGANQVWSALGVRGEGVLVGTIDTGADFDHPALVTSYAGRKPDGTFDHDYAWFDPDRRCTPTKPAPCDDEGHGTAVLGLLVGDGGPGNQVGVAPGARWISAKGCHVYTCDIGSLLAAGQWMLAPTRLDGSDPDVARRPHVIDNSWGAADGAATWFRDAVRAWEASGQFATFAAGDFSRAECSSIASPASYPESYGVGGYDPDGNVLFTSGHGPSPIDGGLKPDVTAPGFQVRTSYPGGTYGQFYGTSASAAHVAGTAALLLSAAPTLRGDPEAIATVIDDTARPPDSPDPLQCGGDTDADNGYGHGRLDAFGAVENVATPGLATISGTVTDADTGDPLDGATVTAGAKEATTTSTGRFTLFVAPGDVELHATAFGHAESAVPLTLAPGAEVQQDLALDALPTTPLTVAVTDGGGHGWPLDAVVRVAGMPGSPGRTDPVTGEYLLDLAAGSYTLHVDAGRGYLPESRLVDVGTDPTTESVELTPDPSCTAPGYSLADGLFEEFDTGSKPSGWTVVNNNVDPFSPEFGWWRFDNPAGRSNLTGGRDGFAILDSDYDFFQQEDAELISPPVDLSQIGNPVLRWRQDLFLVGPETADVDVSTDDGATWSTVWSRSGGESLRGPRVDEVPLPSQDGVRVRFHYYDAQFLWWWQVDDVLIGGSPCTPVAGGLIVGTVTNAATGQPLTGATISAGEASTTSTAGRYTLFSETVGPVDVTGSGPGYTDAVGHTDVVADGVSRLDLALGAGHLVVEQPRLQVTLPADESRTVPLTIRNDGTVDAHVRLAESDRGFTGLGPEPSGARSLRVPVDPSFADRETRQPAPAGVNTFLPWEERAGFPHRLGYHTAAARAGKVYVFGGSHVRDDEYLTASDELHVYSPTADRWRALPRSGREREFAPGAFLGDRLHVVAGTDESFRGTSTHQVYDVSAGTWTTAASLPRNLMTTAMAKLGPDLVTVGGCATLGLTCGAVADAYRYHSATDTWTRLPDYPERVGFLSCGGIDGKVYCSGGAHSDYVESPNAYAYDPETNAWAPIASSPLPTFGAAYAVTSGRLTIVSGVGFGGFAATNDVLSYDPLTDSWEFLPPVGTPTYYGAAACGLYRLGGRVDMYPSPFTRVMEQLPGYPCGSGGVSWLGADPGSFVVPAGGSTTVQVKVGPKGLGRPGDYEAALRVIEDTPGQVRPVRVMVKATTPASWGRVGGAIRGLGSCDTSEVLLSGAVVTVRSGDRRVTTQTGPDGEWSAALPVNSGSVTVTARKRGYLTRIQTVPLQAGASTRRDLDLRLSAPCARLASPRIQVSVQSGERVVVPLALRNAGARSLRAKVAESSWQLRPLPRFSYRGWAAGHPRLGDAPRTPPVAPVPGWFAAEASPSYVGSAGQAQCDGDRRHVYVVSGANGGISVDALWRFDALKNTWTELASLPQDAWPETRFPGASLGVTDASAVCEAGRIHVLGGNHNFETVATHFVYNLASDSWTIAAPLPRVVEDAPVGVWDGKIYLVGGSPEQSRISAEIDVYDIATNTWQVLPDEVPKASDGAAWTQVGPYLYVVSGFVDLGSPDNLATRRLDLRTLTWSFGPDLPAERAFGGMTATREALYVLGGYQVTRAAVPDVFRLARSDWADGEWTTDDPLPERKMSAQGSCSESITGGEILTVGGFDTAFVSNRVLVHPVVPERCPTLRGDVAWLHAGGTPAVDAGGRTTVSVTLDARHLSPGTRRATLLVTTNDPGAPEIRVPVVLEVKP